MTTQWQPYREPLRTTLLRTSAIALVVGGIAARFWGGMSRWPLATLLALWPSFGGHWVEVFFLNWLRPRISAERVVQVAARVAVWFVGGMGMAIGVGITAKLMSINAHWFSLWRGGLIFIGVELVAHAVLQLRGCPSFYNGRG